MDLSWFDKNSATNGFLLWMALILIIMVLATAKHYYYAGRQSILQEQLDSKLNEIEILSKELAEKQQQSRVTHKPRFIAPPLPAGSKRGIDTNSCLECHSAEKEIQRIEPGLTDFVTKE